MNKQKNKRLESLNTQNFNRFMQEAVLLEIMSGSSQGVHPTWLKMVVSDQFHQGHDFH